MCMARSSSRSWPEFDHSQRRDALACSLRSFGKPRRGEERDFRSRPAMGLASLHFQPSLLIEMRCGTGFDAYPESPSPGGESSLPRSSTRSHVDVGPFARTRFSFDFEAIRRSYHTGGGGRRDLIQHWFRGNRPRSESRPTEGVSETLFDEKVDQSLGVPLPGPDDA